MKLSLAMVTLAAAISGCGEENLETPEYNAYFYYPESQREEYLGLVKGISACQAAAGARARSLNMSSSTKWDYICCKKTSSSACESKHR